MDLRLSAAGEMQLSRPQQQWGTGRGGDGKTLQLANFAGQEMMVVIDDASGGFELHFLGFTKGPLPTMDDAKMQAPQFALAVLEAMKSKIR